MLHVKNNDNLLLSLQYASRRRPQVLEQEGLAPGMGPPLTSYPIIPIQNPLNPFAYGTIGELPTSLLDKPHLSTFSHVHFPTVHGTWLALSIDTLGE